MIYRNELKYLCDQRDKAVLESRLKWLLRPDLHGDSSHHYLIKSVYFDDFANTCLHETEDGVDERSKYRIRAYNNCDALIRMEIKSKRSNLGRKESCVIDRDCFDRLVLQNDYPFEPQAGAVYNRFCLLHRTRLLKPVCTVGYDRTAYTLPQGNVRITFDENIYASREVRQFFGSEHRTPVLPAGSFILEIKYDEFLPKHVQQAVSLGNLTQIAFSKYSMGRQALSGSSLPF